MGIISPYSVSRIVPLFSLSENNVQMAPFPCKRCLSLEEVENIVDTKKRDDINDIAFSYALICILPITITPKKTFFFQML